MKNTLFVKSAILLITTSRLELPELYFTYLALDGTTRNRLLKLSIPFTYTFT